MRGAWLRLGGVVTCDGATDDHPSAQAQTGESSVENFSADVVEVHVDTVGSVGLERLVDGFVLVVDGDIEAEVLGEPRALLRTAGDADDLASVELCDLTDQAADRARGTGYDDGVTVFQLSDVEQSEICGDAGNPRAPSQVGRGAIDSSTRVTSVPSDTPYSEAPNDPATMSPTW